MEKFQGRKFCGFHGLISNCKTFPVEHFIITYEMFGGLLFRISLSSQNFILDTTFTVSELGRNIEMYFNQLAILHLSM